MHELMGKHKKVMLLVTTSTYGNYF